MTLLDNQNDTITVTMKMDSEMKMPGRGPFAGFPKLRIVGVIEGDKNTATDFWPTAESIPSTRHPKTIRLINLNWQKKTARVEYDDTSKIIKVFGGNVDSVVIKIS
ncbi:hypothetical protein OBP_077 [Pseudomonas phage OBP]|uniref:hypothetical protein n=1 Tax=Pseudomonas phage OBP TaxID=1124849 RepID=UPI000240D42B|nr:hypothetical protein OBP_077 [Pseudomonas phage OBP]AEV89514.1 hypothetical protein OBP_077 [Pseudomonas phage OBP]